MHNKAQLEGKENTGLALSSAVEVSLAKSLLRAILNVCKAWYCIDNKQQAGPTSPQANLLLKRTSSSAPHLPLPAPPFFPPALTADGGLYP